jgi:DeoR/GlpR family transcriptional regulator of sugar metabolism
VYLHTNGKVTAAKLAKHLGAAGRTVRRDLTMLREAGLIELEGYTYRLVAAEDTA